MNDNSENNIVNVCKVMIDDKLICKFMCVFWLKLNKDIYKIMKRNIGILY